ncbi:ABC transporter substrate-binding protein, partial [Mesorhizobium sp. M2A.F.Ca.ET.037.01.1.1]|uniref:ABC transporter substrate-binding protein n=1 Tax=Mesorhizobium sp. M2A.F.Ca.ET.037.01.1.1 TaxID=2496748 RepID=UPI001AECC93E
MIFKRVNWIRRNCIISFFLGAASLVSLAAHAQDNRCESGDQTGVTSEAINVGSTTLLTGQFGYIGKETNAGLQAAIDELNKGGGLHGRKINFVSYDDAYEPSKALAGARRLIEQDQIFAWVGGVGTPTYLAAAPLLEAAKVPAIAPFAPGNSMGTEKRPLTFNIWTDLRPQFKRVVEYLAEHEGLGSSTGGVAIVHFSTEHGMDAVQGVEEALAPKGLSTVADVVISTDEEDFASVALDLKKSGASWVGLQMGAVQGGALLTAMRDIDYRPGVFGQADFVDEAFRREFPEVAEGFYGPLQI